MYSGYRATQGHEVSLYNVSNLTLTLMGSFPGPSRTSVLREVTSGNLFFWYSSAKRTDRGSAAGSPSLRRSRLAEPEREYNWMLGESNGGMSDTSPCLLGILFVAHFVSGIWFLTHSSCGNGEILHLPLVCSRNFFCHYQPTPPPASPSLPLPLSLHPRTTTTSTTYQKIRDVGRHGLNDK